MSASQYINPVTGIPVPAFSWESLTRWLHEVPVLPQLLNELRLFEPRPGFTTSVAIEQDLDRLAIVPAIPRGAPPTMNVRAGRVSFPVSIPHFPLRSTVMADSVQDVRQTGSQDLMSWETAVRQEQTSHARKLDATVEHLRAGAIKGLVTLVVDKETGAPSNVVDLFATFGIAPQPSVDFPANGLTTIDLAYAGQLAAAARRVRRAIIAAIMMQPVRVIALCGSDFYDAIVASSEVRFDTSSAGRTSILAPVPATGLTPSFSFTSKIFADVEFFDYGGARVGNYAFIKPDEAVFVPYGVPGLFLECYAPAPATDTVNTLALRRYAFSEPLEFRAGLALLSQTNVMPVCVNPGAIVVGKLTAVGSASPASSSPPGPAAPTRSAAGIAGRLAGGS